MLLKEAYKQLEKLQNTGNMMNFMFDSFVDRHVKAYSMIKHLGGDAEDVTDRKKVLDFLAHIKSNKAGVTTAKVQVMANDALGDNFTDCCNCMHKIVNTISKANKQGGKDRRGIGAANSSKSKLAGLAA
jgi:hypothetical protein